MAFDLLRLDGDDLRLRPIEARREALKTARRQVKASADALARYSENLAR
jgi:ATP-dependent DNA ligase